MLKIRSDIDLKELEKYGFIKKGDCYLNYYNNLMGEYIIKLFENGYFYLKYDEEYEIESKPDPKDAYSIMKNSLSKLMKDGLVEEVNK